MLARTAKATRNVLPKPPPFRFQGCLQTPKTVASQQRRLNSTVLLPASTDEKSLITLFDAPKLPFNLSPLSPTGIFGHPNLTHPAALISLANSTLHHAQLLTLRIIRARESRDELFKVVKNLDRLSDRLCGVIDLCELVRNSHPDPKWALAANEAYEMLCEFMNVLNTSVELYEVLKVVLGDPAISKTLSPEAHATAMNFWRDFEKSAIDLSPAHRARFVALSSEILVLGRQFLTEANAARPPTMIKPEELSGLKDKGMGTRLQLQAQFTQRSLQVYPGSMQAQMIMRSAPDEEPRRKVYLAAHSSTPTQVETLEQLLRTRGELARLVGCESFAHMTLNDKMAKSPENVSHFLDALMDYTRPHARKALLTLSKRKQQHLGTSTLPIIQAWDRDFYCPPESPAPPIPLPPLTLGTVMMGLSRLFRHLYGVTLRPATTASGEVWHNDVHKLEVIDDQVGVLGWIYTDLFARKGKPGGAAHYTVRCSRRTDDDDDALDGIEGEDEARVRESKEFSQVMSRRLPGREGVFKLPLVVLLCDFSPSRMRRGSPVLEWQQVVTLFHEMGHAMHSIIGTTEYQNVSGTRCPTDFVELPSILMEHFLNSPQVLSLFDVDSTSSHLHLGTNVPDPCHSIDTHSQIILSEMDQLYHSPAAMSTGRFDSTAALSQLHNTRGLIPHADGTSSQTQFAHLFGYGAMYYSYLFDRAIASRVWSNVFAANPLNRETGERFKREVLSHGGGKDPWEMVSTLLNAPELAGGDAEAMRQVGQWRIEDDVSATGRH